MTSRLFSVDHHVSDWVSHGNKVVSQYVSWWDVTKGKVFVLVYIVSEPGVNAKGQAYATRGSAV